MPKKNLVMGVAQHYSWYVIEPFVRSFLKYRAEDTELVLFVDNISDFTRNCLENFQRDGVLKLEPFTETARMGAPHNTRWKLFLDYLESHDGEYNQVLVADTRDLIFQSDIFKEFPLDNYLGYALEVGEIRNSRPNYNWLVECFGKSEADKISDKTIICCGTVIGTVNEMKIFLMKMLQYISRIDYPGNDQATENYLIYNDILPIENLIPIDCQTGAIFTISVFSAKYTIHTKDDFILRGDGRVPAIAHQYDRSPTLVKFVDEIYRARDFQPDNRFTNAKSAVEQLYHLTRIGNFDGALKFFADNSLHGKNFAGYGDTLAEILSLMLTVNQTAQIEILEVAIQLATANAFADEVDYDNVTKLYRYTDSALKANRTVSTSFKDLVWAYLFQFAKRFMQENDFSKCAAFINEAESINNSPPPEFYLLKMEFCLKIGEKEKSLEAYKNFLDAK